MARILVSDPIDPAGIERLKSEGHEVDAQTAMPPEELESAIDGYDALIVRSETKVTAGLLAKAGRLQVVGRAGVGVDNIDVEAATERGVAVVNAPTGNTVAAAEHAFALMMSVARNIPQADASIRRGEWTRGRFMGVEVRNKTLGIIGLGRVGSEVARRAKGFQMRIIAHDPFVSHDFAHNLGVEMVDMDRLLRESDFITVHTPLTAGTRSLIGAAEFGKLKPGVRIINAARGGLIDEDLLARALEGGSVGGAALDVFSQEPLPAGSPLLSNPKAVLTPHLGASTEEAQAEVAVEVAEQVVAVLRGEPAPYTINVPFVPPDTRRALAPYIPVATAMGRMAIQLAEGQLESVTLRVAGEISQYGTEILRSAALVGVLGSASDIKVNLVNAPMLARERGLRVLESKGPDGDEQYLNLVGVEVRTSRGSTFMAGTSVNGRVHLVRLNDFRVDMEPNAPYMLFVSHVDQPGMIGRVGMISGEADLNISFMEVGRESPRGPATMIVGYDDPVTDEVLARIRALDGVRSAKLVRQA